MIIGELIKYRIGCKNIDRLLKKQQGFINSVFN